MKFALAIIAALLSSADARGPRRDRTCKEDLVWKGYKDKECKQWDYNFPIGKTFKNCIMDPGSEKGKEIYYKSECQNGGHFKTQKFTDSQCKNKMMTKEGESTEYKVDYKPGRCQSKYDREGKTDIYFVLVRNSTDPNYMRNNSKDGKYLRMKKLRNAMNNWTNMTNSSGSVNFTVNGQNVHAMMETGKDRTANSTMSVRGKGYEWTMNYTGHQKNLSARPSEMMEYRVKFDKYFEYGMESKNMKPGSKAMHCKDSSDCNGKYFSKMCCVSAVMTNKRNGLQESMYRCMNHRLANANLQMKMDDMQINMKCVDSSAKHIASGILAMVSMILMALY